MTQNRVKYRAWHKENKKMYEVESRIIAGNIFENQGLIMKLVKEFL